MVYMSSQEYLIGKRRQATLKDCLNMVKYSPDITPELLLLREISNRE